MELVGHTGTGIRNLSAVYSAQIKTIHKLGIVCHTKLMVCGKYIIAG